MGSTAFELLVDKNKFIFKDDENNITIPYNSCTKAFINNLIEQIEMERNHYIPILTSEKTPVILKQKTHDKTEEINLSIYSQFGQFIIFSIPRQSIIIQHHYQGCQ